MEQRRIRELLEEAADPHCPPQRRAEIQQELSEAAHERFRVLAEELFVEVVEHRLELLPVLFPTFAILCGDRCEREPLARGVNWLLTTGL